MHIYYHDIIDQLGEPIWWDECAVPRYCAFTPEECSIYATEVALVRIACQSCGKTFDVAVSADSYSEGCIRDYIINKDLHYGDPPNVECCYTGIVETSISLRVLEYWIMVNHKFTRVPELEVSLGEEQ